MMCVKTNIGDKMSLIQCKGIWPVFLEDVDTNNNPTFFVANQNSVFASTDPTYNVVFFSSDVDGVVGSCDESPLFIGYMFQDNMPSDDQIMQELSYSLERTVNVLLNNRKKLSSENNVTNNI